MSAKYCSKARPKTHVITQVRKTQAEKKKIKKDRKETSKMEKSVKRKERTK